MNKEYAILNRKTQSSKGIGRRMTHKRVRQNAKIALRKTP